MKKAMEARDDPQILTGEWAKTHLVLQQDYMIENVRRVLERYVPASVLVELKDKFAMVCRPIDSGATVIRPELLKGLHVIVLSVHLVPKGSPPMSFPEEYVALVLLHELAHIYLGHHPPSTDQTQHEAHCLALDWYNEAQGRSMTMDDLGKLRECCDEFWIYEDPDPVVTGTEE